MRLIGRQWRAVIVVTIAALSVAPAVTPAYGDAGVEQRSAAELAKVAQVPDRMQLPLRNRDKLTSSVDCEKPTKDGASSCVTIVDRNELTVPAPPQGDVSAAAILPVPLYCGNNPYTGWWVTRTSACSITTLKLVTQRTVNGVTTTTGEANMNVYLYAYSSTTQARMAYQIQISMYSSWGDASAAFVSGRPVLAGACVTESNVFPSQSLQPTNSFKNGEWYFNTTATASGAIGYCDPAWEITFATVGYTPASVSFQAYVFRCDNATGGNPNVGCVIPQYPSALLYFSSSYPDLAAHVSRAQASGLPGGSFEAPLTRSTDGTIEARNRALACGDAPSIDGKSCDEYPLATTRNGLSAGGTRRIFDNCGFVPQPGSGPSGASACMINASENNAQGGLNTQFYRQERVLDGDPFRVVVI